LEERSRQLRRGFTLLELILVMVILSTVLALAAPSLRGFFASRQIHDAAAQILSLIQLAGSEAASQGTTYRLNFDTAEGMYWLTARQGGSFDKLGTEFGRQFSLPRDTTVELTGASRDARLDYIAFGPEGTFTPATITLTDRRGEKMRLVCPSATEPFSIVEGDDR